MAVVTLDGAVESQTAAVLEPYAGRGAADGLMKLSPQDLTKTVSTLDSHGWQVAVTANGDRAVRAALDAYEAAAAPRSRVAERRRHRIEGVELVDPDDVPRFEGLGVIASLQPAHARPDRLQVWSRNVGPERAALGWASHSLAGGRRASRVWIGLAQPSARSGGRVERGREPLDRPSHARGRDRSKRSDRQTRSSTQAKRSR